MKKRILLLIPCLLLALGLLTACGDNGSQSSGSIENQLINAKWTTTVDNEEDFKGLIDIDLPFDLGKLVTIKFDSNKTGYIQIGQTGLVKVGFTWSVVSGEQVNLKFGSGIGDHSFDLTFHLDKDSLSLKGSGIDINLSRQ